LKAIGKKSGSERDIVKWEKYSKLKEDIINLAANQNIKSKTLIGHLISTRFQEPYLLQHPGNLRLKTNDNNEKWVQDYLRDGGKIESLKARALESRGESATKALKALKMDKASKNQKVSAGEVKSAEASKSTSTAGADNRAGGKKGDF